jgi:hypothetical protein
MKKCVRSSSKKHIIHIIVRLVPLRRKFSISLFFTTNLECDMSHEIHLYFWKYVGLYKIREYMSFVSILFILSSLEVSVLIHFGNNFI